MIQRSRHSVEEAIAALEGNATLDGFKLTRWNRKRLRVFVTYGVDCYYCGLPGSYFAVERHENDRGSGWHLNLYGEIPNGSGRRMMTIDHVIPKSKGGSNKINNLRPACYKCNTKKSNNMNWEGPAEHYGPAWVRQRKLKWRELMKPRKWYRWIRYWFKFKTFPTLPHKYVWVKK